MPMAIFNGLPDMQISQNEKLWNHSGKPIKEKWGFLWRTGSSREGEGKCDQEGNGRITAFFMK